jgi:hypothetical protein
MGCVDRRGPPVGAGDRFLGGIVGGRDVRVTCQVTSKRRGCRGHKNQRGSRRDQFLNQVDISMMKVLDPAVDGAVCACVDRKIDALWRAPVHIGRRWV